MSSPASGDTPVSLNPQRKANPFEGMERIFAADADPIRHDFTVAGLACFVEVLPLDASGHNQLELRLIDAVSRMEAAKQGAGLADTALDDLELFLLEKCVSNFRFAERAQVNGQRVWQHTAEGATLTPETRRGCFQRLSKDFRQALVDLCFQASGMEGPDPLGLAAEAQISASGETPASTPASSTSPDNTPPPSANPANPDGSASPTVGATG